MQENHQRSQKTRSEAKSESWAAFEVHPATVSHVKATSPPSHQVENIGRSSKQRPSLLLYQNNSGPTRSQPYPPRRYIPNAPAALPRV
ncbi:hypothetical protein BDW02DRAFT_72385 [Decorospora gaudefroyi]|uniref:Uncharacterized protein n=1 Tax=Decorospora gaudefroyi TaxID=184978 RepID=A0A6A5K2P4_9PLEO|nr:hypothetical protein BDW02DRAFT_72385 [Decorospora gaudefroyi]